MHAITWAVLGDSTGLGIGAAPMEGYVERLRATLASVAPLRLLNFAESGATSGRVLANQLPRALRARPDVAVVFVGGNDLWRGIAPVEYARSMDAIALGLATTGALASSSESICRPFVLASKR